MQNRFAPPHEQAREALFVRFFICAKGAIAAVTLFANKTKKKRKGIFSMKKILSMLLAVLMVLSMLPVVALAEEAGQLSLNEQEEVVSEQPVSARNPKPKNRFWRQLPCPQPAEFPSSSRAFTMHR